MAKTDRMLVSDVSIPATALDAGRRAMVDGFKAAQVQAAVSAALAADPDFAYPATITQRKRDEIEMRVADRLIQRARSNGDVSFKSGRWTVLRTA